MKILKKIVASLMLIAVIFFYLPNQKLYAASIYDGGTFNSLEEGISQMYTDFRNTYRIDNGVCYADSSWAVTEGTRHKWKHVGSDGSVIYYLFTVIEHKSWDFAEKMTNPSYVEYQKRLANQSDWGSNITSYLAKDYANLANDYSKDDNETLDYYNDCDNAYYSEPVEPEPTPVTVSATKISMEMKAKGIYIFKIEFDNTDAYLDVKKAPTFKVKLGEKTRTLEFVHSSKNSLIYQTKIEEVDLGGKTITIDSISGGEIELKKANTVTIMDYTTKLTNKTIGTIQKFIIVNNGARGDINKDGRLDKLDVDNLQNSKDKTIADLNGDNKINVDDKNALAKSIEKQDLIYIRFITVGTDKQHYGDVCKADGSAGYDGIINYKDYEYIANAVANNRRTLTYGDVNGDGKLNSTDVSNIAKALKTGNEMYIHHIKVNRNIVGDINNDGVINSEDVFALSKKPSNGDINSDGKVDARDQATLMSALMSEDIDSLVYIAVPENSKGDIDRNGLINKADANRLAAAISRRNVDSEVNVDIADVNGDGKVNARDVSFIIEGLKNEGDINNKAYLTLMSYGFSQLASKTDNKGDVNGDSVVNAIDAQLIANYLADTKNNNINLENADFNGDGKVNVRDSAAIANLLKSLQKDSLANINPAEEKEEQEIQKEIIYGDVDLSGQVGINDIICLSKYIASSVLFPLDENQLACADLNQDNAVNAIDAQILIEYNLRKITELPVTKK